MTLEEKIGQMVQIDRSVATVNIMRDYFIGSVLSGGGSAPLPEASAQNWVDMINEYQKGALVSRLGIPMIYGIDAVHGHNNVYNATIFPHNVGLGATRDPDLVKRIGAATAVEVRATGIPYTFAPCIAVNFLTVCLTFIYLALFISLVLWTFVKVVTHSLFVGL
jgi:beta-glucosidase